MTAFVEIVFDNNDNRLPVCQQFHFFRSSSTMFLTFLD